MDGDHLGLNADCHFVPLQVKKGGDAFASKDHANRFPVTVLGLELQTSLFAVDSQGELKKKKEEEKVLNRRMFLKREREAGGGAGKLENEG